MRLIDADELKKDDEVNLWISRDAVRAGKQLKMFSELFVKKIDDAPTVDAIPFKRCKNCNIDYADFEQFVCSECGIEISNWNRVERDGDDMNLFEYVFKYCPNCGAKVRNDDD